MKKIILLTSLFFMGITLYSQTSLTMDNVTKYGSSIIKPTWKNLSKLLTCDMSTFNATMKVYKYTIATDGSAYIADTQVGSPYFTIKKRNNNILMIFTEDDGFASLFRTEVKKLFGGSTVKYEGEYEVYHVFYKLDGLTYNIKIAIKENMDGSSSIGIIII